MANYNLTLIQEATGVPEYVDVVNTYTDGVLVGMFLVALFFIMFMIMKRYDFEKALFTSSFLSFMFSLMLLYAGWINFIFVLVFFILMALTGLYMFTVRK